MALHANAEIVRSFFEAQAANDFDTLLKVISEDVIWHLPRGGTRLSGVEDVVGLGELAEMSARNAEASEGTFQFDVEQLFAGDQYAAVVSHNTARAGGRVLDLRMVIFFRITAGQIAEVWEAPDDFESFSEFWRE